MITENGIKEAVETLKENVSKIFDRVHHLEMSGCAMREPQDCKIEKLEDEVKDMKEKLDEMRMLLYKLIGAAVVLMWIGSFVANIIAKKI